LPSQGGSDSDAKRDQGADIDAPLLNRLWSKRPQLSLVALVARRANNRAAQ
jgi:hypothetical protein